LVEWHYEENFSLSSFAYPPKPNFLDLLSQIDRQPGVIGSLMVGYDGKLIAHSLKKETDAEPLGVCALGMFQNSETAIRKMGRMQVHQIVSKTDLGHIVIANCGNGLLVTLSNDLPLDGLILLMRSITLLIAS